MRGRSLACWGSRCGLLGRSSFFFFFSLLVGERVGGLMFCVFGDGVVIGGFG